MTVVEAEIGGRSMSVIDDKAMSLILYKYHVFYRYPDLVLLQLPMVRVFLGEKSSIADGISEPKTLPRLEALTTG